MRSLAIGANGVDVTHLQQAINARSRARNMPAVKVDGVFGRKTRRAAERVARALGAREDAIAKRPLTVGVQRMIRYPAARTLIQLARARDRRHEHHGNGHARKGAFGIDWSAGTPRSLALHTAGVRFACRYLSFSAAKNLTHAEAKELAAAGLDLVVVWETTAGRALAGRTAGAGDAREALRQANACGMPDGRPIYFAVDFDEGVGQAAAVAEYFRGVASVLGKQRTGAYGGYWAIKRLFDAGLIRFAWQTYAWSNGKWDGRAQLHQYSNGHALAGVSCDYNSAMADEFGQWRPTR